MSTRVLRRAMALRRAGVTAEDLHRHYEARRAAERHTAREAKAMASRTPERFTTAGGCIELRDLADRVRSAGEDDNENEQEEVIDVPKKKKDPMAMVIEEVPRFEVLPEINLEEAAARFRMREAKKGSR